MHGIIYITECQGQEFWSSWKGQLWTAVGRRNEILKRCPEEGHARRRQMQKGSFRLNVFSRLKLPSPLQFPQTAQPISQKAKQIQNRLLPQGRNLAFLRKGLEGVSTTQCGTFLLVGEFVQLLNDLSDYNPSEWNHRGEERWWVRQEGERVGKALLKGNLHGWNSEWGSLATWNLFLGLNCGVSQGPASMTVLT